MKKQTKKEPANTPAAKSTRKPAAADPVHVEVIPAGSPASVMGLADQARIENVLGMVRQDIRNAEVGKFFALRAGVGLIVVKEMCDHGEWATEMVRMIPDRHADTLRRYMRNARDFLDSKALMARDIWDKLASVGSSALGAAAAGLLLGDGSDRAASSDPQVEVPNEVRAMADYLRDQGNATATTAGAKQAEPRRLTVAEKRRAAADLWQSITARVSEATRTNSWLMLDAELLETFASVLRTASDGMMRLARESNKKR